jgi:hypothetical protein
MLPLPHLESGIWNFPGRPAVSGLAALWCSDFPLLRLRVIKPDFSDLKSEAAITRLALLQDGAIITRVFKRYSHNLVLKNPVKFRRFSAEFRRSGHGQAKYLNPIRR